jgi:hypothetical protein
MFNVNFDFSGKFADLDKLEKRAKRKGAEMQNIRNLKKMFEQQEGDSQTSISATVNQETNDSIEKDIEEDPQPQIDSTLFMDYAFAELDEFFGIKSGDIILDSDDEGDEDEDSEDEDDEAEIEEDSFHISSRPVAVQSTSNNEGNYPIWYHELLLYIIQCKLTNKQLTDVKVYDLFFPSNPFSTKEENIIRFNEIVFRNKLANKSSSDMKKLFNFMTDATGNTL